MQPKTKQRLLQAYIELQETAAMLYQAVQEAADDGNHFDAMNVIVMTQHLDAGNLDVNKSLTFEIFYSKI